MDKENIALLSLEEIASWQIDKLCNRDNCKIKAGLPALQRGLVWKPQQIETLWDSIMRNFPIGSIVLTPYLPEQGSKADSIWRAEPYNPDYHLLDGQQRCHAIALGYYLPNLNEKIPSDKKTKSMLWVDLKPKFPKNSTRKNLFRITTTAHPWGYDNDDASRRLTQSDISKFMNIYSDKHKCLPQKDNKCNPICCSVPQCANLPIPLALVLQNIENNSIKWDNILSNEWIAFIDDWNRYYEKRESLSEFLCERKNQSHIENEWLNISKIKVPAIFLELDDNSNTDPMPNIELIFTRLNSQGTAISQEDLQYSLIKTYYPEVESEVIGEIKDNLPVGEARLVILGVQAFNIINDKSQSVSIDSIRSIFKNNDENLKAEVKKYLKGNFIRALNWIERYIVYKKENTIGLPPYLRSSIAWNSREVFLWWLLLAEEVDYDSLSYMQISRILAISLAIHWLREKKDRVMRKLLDLWKKGQDKDRIDWEQWNLRMLQDEDALLIPVCPEVWHRKITKQINYVFDDSFRSNANKIDDSRNLLITLDDEGDLTGKGDINFARLAHKLWNKQEFLVYSQREYLSSMEYNPSNKSLWENHNRPWDYDHILATKLLDATGSKWRDYTGICKVFQQSIGNQIAIPFGLNRSKNAQEFKIEMYDEVLIKYFFLRTEEPYSFSDSNFVIKLEDTQDKNKAEGFVRAANERMYLLYKQWFDDLNIGVLLPDSPAS